MATSSIYFVLMLSSSSPLALSLSAIMLHKYCVVCKNDNDTNEDRENDNDNDNEIDNKIIMMDYEGISSYSCYDRYSCTTRRF